MGMKHVCGVTADRESVVLELHEDGKALAHIVLDSNTAEQLIRDLAKCRANLNEEVAQELDPGARVEIERSPAWKVPDTHTGSTGTLLLALRHPGMGWLGFLLPEHSARELGKALAETPAPRPKSP